MKVLNYRIHNQILVLTILKRTTLGTATHRLECSDEFQNSKFNKKSADYHTLTKGCLELLKFLINFYHFSSLLVAFNSELYLKIFESFI